MFRVIAVSLFAVLCCAPVAAQTSAANLAGMKQVLERVQVSLQFKHAQDIAVDPAEIVKIVQQALVKAGLEVVKTGTGIPQVTVQVIGEGASSYYVTVNVAMTMPSPLRKERSVTAIIWSDSTTGASTLRYDPAAKELIRPSISGSEMVYDSVREIMARLTTALRSSR